MSDTILKKRGEVLTFWLQEIWFLGLGVSVYTSEVKKGIFYILKRSLEDHIPILVFGLEVSMS